MARRQLTTSPTVSPLARPTPSAAAGPSVGSHLLLAYLPTPLAVAGARLQVECMGERYPVTVEVAGNGAVFDPGNERMRA